MTNESAICKYSTTSGVIFDSMPNIFSTTGGTMHSSVVSGLSNGGSYTYYVRCRDDAGNANTNDFNISFTVNTGQPTNQAPLVNAGPDQTITLPASASLSGTATDDGLPIPPGMLTTTWSKVSGPGTVTFGNANSLNTTASFSLAGTYVLRLTGNDSLLSANDDVTITANNGSAAGLLAGSVATPAASVDLSLEGTSDWAHWGLTSATSFNHKSGVTQKISNFTKIGSGGVLRYGGGSFSYSWTGGTPTASAMNTTAGVWRGGVGKGFQITVPADTTDRTLKLHVGVSNAQGRLEVSLSDGSAAPYINSLDDVVPMGNTHAVYTINFRAASAGRTLTVKWTVMSISSGSGNVTLQAATLADGLLASRPVTPDQPVYFKRASAMSALSLLGVLMGGTRTDVIRDEQRR
jgi:hypothetical protein